MKRLLWTLTMSLIAVVLGVTAPAPVAASDPCHEHDCHNSLECFQEGCLEGCAPLGKCNPPS